MPETWRARAEDALRRPLEPDEVAFGERLVRLAADDDRVVELLLERVDAEPPVVRRYEPVGTLGAQEIPGPAEPVE